MSFLHWFFRRNAAGSALEGIQPVIFKDDVTVEGTLTSSDGITSSGGLTETGGANLSGGVLIAGVTYSSGDGSPEGVVAGNRKGDKYVDYTNGNEYIFQGTAEANTGWVQLDEVSGE